MGVAVVILAAGQGKRMQSASPKVLHPLAGRPLLGHVIDTARQLRPEMIAVVHGHGGERLQAAFSGSTDLVWVEQAEQRGTGHALQQALPVLGPADTVLVLYGDVPLITVDTLDTLLRVAGGGCGLLTVDRQDPTGYGRIVRDAEGGILRIVEHRDADPETLTPSETNKGMMIVPHADLARWLPRLSADNSQGEYYLTDIVAFAVAEGQSIAVAQPASALEVDGVNDRVQLATVERAYQRRVAERMMRAGVTLVDPGRIDVRGDVRHGRDIEIDVNVVLAGEVVLGDDVRIGPGSVLRDVTIASGTEIGPHCVLEQARIGAGCRIGPFARLRPGTDLADGVHVGNFVEVKQTTVGPGSKINHLSYVGDSTIGSGVNIGAGTITCNYDGAAKHRTVIGDNAFIGSNTALVAPVNIGADATIGAGSVISRDAPADKLTLARARQVSLAWKRPRKGD
jgi:bifunctional UDP-N-acetylglucosamine pyrophosphorylase / glucosamine-1-phosphate N-acetyltransferase